MSFFYLLIQNNGAIKGFINCCTIWWFDRIRKLLDIQINYITSLFIISEDIYAILSMNLENCYELCTLHYLLHVFSKSQLIFFKGIECFIYLFSTYILIPLSSIHSSDVAVGKHQRLLRGDYSLSSPWYTHSSYLFTRETNNLNIWSDILLLWLEGYKRKVLRYLHLVQQFNSLVQLSLSFITPLLSISLLALSLNYSATLVP